MHYCSEAITRVAYFGRREAPVSVSSSRLIPKSKKIECLSIKKRDSIACRKQKLIYCRIDTYGKITQTPKKIITNNVVVV